MVDFDIRLTEESAREAREDLADPDRIQVIGAEIGRALPIGIEGGLERVAGVIAGQLACPEIAVVVRTAHEDLLQEQAEQKRARFKEDVLALINEAMIEITSER